MKKEQKQSLTKGYLLMLITVIIWGIDNVFTKRLLNDSIAPIFLIYIRFIFATLLVSIILKFKKETYPKDNINADYKKHIIIMSILLFVFYIIQINGINMTKAVISEFVGTAMTSLSTIIILAIFIKSERKQALNKFSIISLLIAIFGTLFVAFGDININFDFGVLLIFIADIFWGLYIMTYMKINTEISSLRVNRDLGIIAIIICSFILLFTNQFQELLTLNYVQVLKICFMALLIDVGTIITYYTAIRIISGVKCSILSLASPIISFLLSYFWLGERIAFTQILGCIFLFTSSIILVIKDYKENKKTLEN